MSLVTIALDNQYPYYSSYYLVLNSNGTILCFWKTILSALYSNAMTQWQHFYVWDETRSAQCSACPVYRKAPAVVSIHRKSPRFMSVSESIDSSSLWGCVDDNGMVAQTIQLQRSTNDDDSNHPLLFRRKSPHLQASKKQRVETMRSTQLGWLPSSRPWSGHFISVWWNSIRESMLPYLLQSQAGVYLVKDQVRFNLDYRFSSRSLFSPRE